MHSNEPRSKKRPPSGRFPPGDYERERLRCTHRGRDIYTVSPPLENKSSLNRPCTERNIDRMFRGRMEQPFTWKLEETVCVEL